MLHYFFLRVSHAKFVHKFSAQNLGRTRKALNRVGNSKFEYYERNA